MGMLWKSIGLGLLPALLAADVPQGILGTAAGMLIQNGVPANATGLGDPTAVVVDNAGNLYIADANENRIRKIDAATGLIYTIAGTGQPGYNGDFQAATSAELNIPTAIAYWQCSTYGNCGGTSAGTATFLYIADAGNNRIRRVNLDTNLIDTIAGTGAQGYSGDGVPAILASLDGPQGVAADASYVYFSDTNNNRIRRINMATMNIDTIAGGPTGAGGYNGDGPSVPATVDTPIGMRCDQSGHLFVADAANNRIRRLDLSPTASAINITTVAGTGADAMGADGLPGLATALEFPEDVDVNAAGDLLIADTGDNTTTPTAVVRRLYASTQYLSIVAGTLNNAGFGGDGGPATAAQMSTPWACEWDFKGDIFICDGGNTRVRKVDAATGTIDTIAGIPLFDDVPALDAMITTPSGVLVLPNHDVVIADSNGNRILMLDHLSRHIFTLAGDGFGNYFGDGGLAVDSEVNSPVGVAVDKNGTIYFADSGNNVIRCIFTTGPNAGNIETFAGTGNYGSNGYGGPATSADLANPHGVCVSGNSLFFTEFDSNAVRFVDIPSGTIYLVAGSPFFMGAHIDGTWLLARFNQPNGVAADSKGNLYVTEAGSNDLRYITVPTQTGAMVSTVAGLGVAGFSGDGGPALSAALHFPAGLRLDPNGKVVFADAGNNRVRVYDPVSGTVDTLVGNGLQGYSGDNGPALQGSLDGPQDVAFDGVDTLFVADGYNAVVRKVDYAGTRPLSGTQWKPAAYPSPTRGPLCISYSTCKPGPVTVEIYNSALQMAARCSDSSNGLGPQKTCTDVGNLAPGGYVYRVVQPGCQAQTGKFEVLR